MRMGKGEIMRKKAYKTWTVLWTVVSFAMIWILVGNKETEKGVWTAVWTNKIYIKIKTCAFSMIKMNNPRRESDYSPRIIYFHLRRNYLGLWYLLAPMFTDIGATFFISNISAVNVNKCDYGNFSLFPFPFPPFSHYYLLLLQAN